MSDEQNISGANLSQDDINTLIDNPSSENKKALIDKLSVSYNSHQFTELQRERAEKIFRNLLSDTEAEVRRAISDNLVSNADVPVDIVLSLAKDIEEVACPILEFSEVISDDDLLEIINETQSEEHMSAIANRASVSENISDALIDTNNKSVVSSLLDNIGAEINNTGYDKVIDNFVDNEEVIDSLATRSSITEKIVKKMVNAISDSMRERLEDRYQTNIEELHNLFDQGTEAATMQILGQPVIDSKLVDLVNTLDKKGQLVEAIERKDSYLMSLLNELGKDGQYPIIPAIAVGNLPLVCIVFSIITNVPYTNIVKLIKDQRGHEALHMKAKLPKRMFACVSFVISVIKDMHQSGEAGPDNYINDNLHLFIQKLRNKSEGQNINQLNNFIKVIEHNADQQSGGW